jgi:rhodanese-related sulfurtransferase
MIESLTATEAAALIATGTVDVVDVRDVHEWLAGHIPGVRLVPLDRLRVDPEAALPKRDGIIFVCAKGVRSLTAAKLAERLGYTNLYNLDGGTVGWGRAGLPIIVEERVAA